jgi:FkbM family methyltransferase
LLTYKQKLNVLRFIRKIFNIFDFQIFYSKKINYLKGLNIRNIIDVGVATGTKELLYNFPNAYYHLIEPNPTFHEYIYKNLLKKFKGKLYKIAAGNKSGTFEFYDFGTTSGFLKRQDYKITKKIKVKLDKLDNIIKPKKKHY